MTPKASPWWVVKPQIQPVYDDVADYVDADYVDADYVYADYFDADDDVDDVEIDNWFVHSAQARGGSGTGWVTPPH